MEADVAIVVIAQSSHENADRTDLNLVQSSLVASIAAAQPNTIVVTVSPGPFLTPWRAEPGVRAILDLGMAGEQEGNACADVLFGDVNPGGKMPHTMPNTANEMNMTGRQYPGVPAVPTKTKVACSRTPTAPSATGLNPQGGTGFAECVPTKAHYDEKLLVGYRWYDAHHVAPAFPFGHGLSYTTFQFTDLVATAHGIAVTVANNGSVTGTEVVQVYIGFPSSAGEPPLQLKAFNKTQPLAPGESTRVTMALTVREFSIWNVTSHQWSVAHGEHTIRVGASSRDIRLRTLISV
jgi:beta-glucosidase